MRIYIHDGSFEGLLTCIFNIYESKSTPGGIVSHVHQQISLVDEQIPVETDFVKSKRVYQAIREKISPTALEKAYHVYLTETEESGMMIYEYVKLGFTMGRLVEDHLSDPRVLSVHKTSQRVGFETHRMLGFLRFRLIGENTYYAPFQPDSNILALVAPHFTERLSDQNWMIHDLRRGIAAVWNQQEWVLTDLSSEVVPAPCKTDEKYQALWKEFYHTIAISTRYNPKLQKQLMPARYWKYITEKW